MANYYDRKCESPNDMEPHEITGNPDVSLARRQQSAKKEFEECFAELKKRIDKKEGALHEFNIIAFDVSDMFTNVARMAQELEEALTEYQEERDKQKQNRSWRREFEARMTKLYQQLYPAMGCLVSTGANAATVRSSKILYSHVCRTFFLRLLARWSRVENVVAW